MKLSIAEIINKLDGMSEDDQLIWLKKNKSYGLDTVLEGAYNPLVEWLLPNSRPPWTKNNTKNLEGAFWGEVRRLRIFSKSGAYDTLNQLKRESLFIQMLESIDDADAEVVVSMIVDRKFKGLSKETVDKYFA